MLAVDTDAAASKETSNSMINWEPDEEEDDWVVVKKQRITILVPPPSPLLPQTTSPDMNSFQAKSRRRVKRSSGARKKGRGKLSKGDHKKPSATPTPPENVTPVNGIGISSRAQEPNHNLVAPLEKLKQPLLVHAFCDGRSIPHCNRIGISSRAQEPNHYLVAPLEKLKQPLLAHAYCDGRSIPLHGNTRTFGDGPRPLPMGALNVVNQRVKALNLERKLKGLGGLRRWLVSQGLDRFVAVFEREKVRNHQLINLTMSKLKDMGTDAVGPRRKLIHAIDRLCQPYYIKALQ